MLLLLLAGCFLSDDEVAGDLDPDGDGYAWPADCDNADGDVHPGAEEVPYDGSDNDCSEESPDDDLDGDGYGVDEDCDDLAADVNPGQEGDEVDPHGIDRNCDGVDGVDLDGDGYAGNGVGLNRDCDENEPAINPGADEVCDGIDNDCDGATDDEDDDVVNAPSWYLDMDQDGFGDPEIPVAVCVQPSGFVEGADDCDDSDSGINPSATEVCDDDDVDEDCDGLSDDSDPDVAVEGFVVFYRDSDSDGYGSETVYRMSCDPDADYVDNDGDCDDASTTTNPGAEDSCLDSVDNDCDLIVDEGSDELCYSGDELLISEIMYNPAGPNGVDDTWFEVYNYANHPIDMRGMRVWEDNSQAGEEAFVISVSLVVPVGGRVVFCYDESTLTDASFTHAGYLGACDYTYGVENNESSALGAAGNPSFRLRNDSQTYVGISIGGLGDSSWDEFDINQLYYQTSGDWPHNPRGWSIELNEQLISEGTVNNGVGDAWCHAETTGGARPYYDDGIHELFGTPGSTNSCR
ncbi:MAG: hypothetical protein H6739_37810 [Alphaproteobacteria bacterium]|nr:hypothetical protein [Alphaproteobacteria bacterium]